CLALELADVVIDCDAVRPETRERVAHVLTSHTVERTRCQSHTTDAPVDARREDKVIERLGAPSTPGAKAGINAISRSRDRQTRATHTQTSGGNQPAQRCTRVTDGHHE